MSSPSNADYIIYDYDEFMQSDFDLATSSDAIDLSPEMEVIHNDIQLLNFTLLFIFVILFVLFLNNKWRFK